MNCIDRDAEEYAGFGAPMNGESITIRARSPMNFTILTFDGSPAAQESRGTR